MTDPVASGQALFVILPNVNVWNLDNPGASQTFLRSASRQFNASPRPRLSLSAVRPGLEVTLLDEVAPSDTALVAMGEAQRIRLLQTVPGLRLAPVEVLEPLWLQRFKLARTLGPAAGVRQVLEVQVLDGVTQSPMAEVDVVGLTDRANRVGVVGKTNARGIARLTLSASADALESVEAFPPAGHWPSFALKVDPGVGRLTLNCAPIDFTSGDLRRHFGFEGQDKDGEGVKVAVIDTGVSRHKDLRIALGRNVVKGEAANAYGDVLGHGTHVAGVIAGRGKPGQGVRGVAPGVELHAYRVFGKDSEQALSFNIAKGIRQAVDDGCDLINLSLGGGVDIPDVLREIQRARALGVVCVAATGNDFRGPVSYPARYSPVLAVSAFGRKGTWPAQAAQELEVAKPFGVDRKDFIAAFSNVGSEVKLTGPGVGVVSTYPGGYAVMDGTSMACPVITGAVARLLSRQPKLLAMDRDQKRSDAIVKLALQATPLGFGATFEGAGCLL